MALVKRIKILREIRQQNLLTRLKSLIFFPYVNIEPSKKSGITVNITVIKKQFFLAVLYKHKKYFQTHYLELECWEFSYYGINHQLMLESYLIYLKPVVSIKSRCYSLINLLPVTHNASKPFFFLHSSRYYKPLMDSTGLTKQVAVKRLSLSTDTNSLWIM